MKKTIVSLVLLSVFLAVLLFATLTARRPVYLTISRLDILDVACRFHGITEAHFTMESNIPHFYFVRNGKRCPLFTNDFRQYYIGELYN